jgi:hypothetical protein
MKCLLIILLFPLALVSKGQMQSTELNEPYTQSVDENELKYLIRTDSIHIRNIWSVTYDSIGKVKDSILESRLYYDKNGRNVELQFQFNRDLKSSEWIKYFYNDEGYLIRTENSYFILDGAYVDENSEDTVYITNQYVNGLLVESKRNNRIKPDKVRQKNIYLYNKMGLLSEAKHYKRDKLISAKYYEYIKF